MKVLFYNWDPLGGPAGGGVTAYLFELTEYLLSEVRDIDIWFLNSGRRYDDTDKIYIREYKSKFGDAVHTYEVVNSPILAAGRQSVVNFEKYVYDKTLSEIVAMFIEECGFFDVIHFHNIEGLSLDCLKLKERFNNTKFILSLHNYFPFCPQVNLWRNSESNCLYDDFSLCASCFPYENYELTKYRFKHLDVLGLKEEFSARSAVAPDEGDSGIYETFISKNVEAINECFDFVLCVSKRTRFLAERAGISDEILRLSYAGSKIATNVCSIRHFGNDVFLRIIYLGYGSKEKGFYFFLNAFSNMSNDLLKRLKVTIIAKVGEERCKFIEECLKSRGLAKVIVINGYKDYDCLKKIMIDQDLGIVPTLWEDNFPRVAVEQFAMGVPLLTSDLGGAKELGGENQTFIFRAGDEKDYIKKLDYIANNKEVLREYFNHAVGLTTMNNHVKDLMNYYGKK